MHGQCAPELARGRGVGVGVVRALWPRAVGGRSTLINPRSGLMGEGEGGARGRGRGTAAGLGWAGLAGCVLGCDGTGRPTYTVAVMDV